MPDARKPVFLISTAGKTKDQVKAEAREALLKFQHERRDAEARDERVSQQAPPDAENQNGPPPGNW